MEKQEKKIFKWFWPWQDRNREDWLRQMSLDGWHLNSIGYLGLSFRFRPGEKRAFVYQLDYRQESASQMSEYLDLFENAGWEHILSWNGWQHFRKPVENGEEEQIFTDNQSKIQKYKRVLVNLSLFSPAFMVVFLAKMNKYPLWFAILLVTVIISLSLYVAVSMLMISARIKQLEKEG